MAESNFEKLELDRLAEKLADQVRTVVRELKPIVDGLAPRLNAGPKSVGRFAGEE